MPPTWLQITVAIFAFSGWAKIFYDHISSKPRIRGRIFNSIRANMNYKKNDVSLFFTYIYIYNTRKNSVHILDYKMEAYIDKKWIALDRVYGFHNAKNPVFNSEQGEIKFKNLSDSLIYRKKLPVEYGIPISGWMAFCGPKELHRKESEKYRITCIDSFKKKHSFTTKTKDFENLFLLMEIEDLEIPL